MFSSVAIVTVALGVGLNTSVFGIVNVLLFRPPPAENAHELVWLSSASVKPNGPRGNMTYPDVDDLRSLPVFRGVMAYGEVQANVAAEGQAERLDGHIVSGDYFLVLGTKAHRGRLVASADDTPGNDGRGHQLPALAACCSADATKPSAPAFASTGRTSRSAVLPLPVSKVPTCSQRQTSGCRLRPRRL